jgi:hypothetical protein
MNNLALATQQQPGQLVVVVAPAMPPVLVAAVESYGGMDSVLRRAPIAVIEAAQDCLPALESYIAPAPPLFIERWLRKLRGACAEISEDTFKARMEAVKLASGDLPGFVWSNEALIAAMRSETFFPTAKQVDDMLRPRAGRARHAAWATRALAAATPIPPEPSEALAPPQNRLLADVAKSMKPNYGGAETGGRVGR